MDISDDMCRSEFFDLVPMGLDPKFGDAASHGLMPVTLLDSSDYIMTDGNNNLGSATGHIKSFLDEMFLADPINGGEGGQNIATLSNSTFEVLGTFQWTGDSTSGGNSANASGDDDSPATDPNSWFLNPGFNNGDVEVTTLTNLIDPLFVTYEEDQGGNIVTTKVEQHLGENRVVSSDLISSTFLNEPTSESPTEGSQSSSESELISWQKNSEVVGNGNNVYCDDSLLRSALQSGNNASTISSSKVMKLTAVITSPPPTNEMTELRKVLSVPPLTSPTSSTSDPAQPGGQQPYYDLKVIDPIFGDDANIPNVQELIMTRIDPPFGGYQQGKDQKKKLEISERKINSTTLSTKWTYTTTNNEHGKTPRRRNKKANGNNLGLKKAGVENGVANGGPYSPTSKSNGGSSSGSPNSQQSGGPGSSSGNSTNGNGIRKERSLHYCNICCKGFKDKYSVNVHVRTHTGEKPFSCNLCGKNFRQKAHLAKHYQTHAAKANNQHNKPNSKR